MQQAVLERGAGDLDAVGQHEAALELARGDAAMQEDPALGVVVLPAADQELVVLQRDREVGLGEPRHRQRDAVRGFAALLDVARRIAVAAGLGGALDQPVELLETQEVGMRSEGDPCHVVQPLSQATLRRGPVAATPTPRKMGTAGRRIKGAGD